MDEMAADVYEDEAGVDSDEYDYMDPNDPGPIDDSGNLQSSVVCCRFIEKSTRLIVKTSYVRVSIVCCWP